MKNTTRFFIAFILILSLCLALCLFVSAEEAEENAPEPQIAVSEENGASETVEETQGFASVVWDWVSEHLPEIFSGAGVVGVGVLLFLWKKGLLPIVDRVLKKIAESVTTTSKSLEGKNDEMSKTLLGFMEQIQPYLPLLKELTESLKAVRSEKEAQLVINKGVFDMLGLIIETARVPDSVKEQYRLYKAKADKAMMEIEAGDPS